jgi:hypothetical protein
MTTMVSLEDSANQVCPSVFTNIRHQWSATEYICLLTHAETVIGST